MKIQHGPFFLFWSSQFFASYSSHSLICYTDYLHMKKTLFGCLFILNINMKIGDSVKLRWVDKALSHEHLSSLLPMSLLFLLLSMHFFHCSSSVFDFFFPFICPYTPQSSHDIKPTMSGPWVIVCVWNREDDHYVCSYQLLKYNNWNDLWFNQQTNPKKVDSKHWQAFLIR